MNSKEALKELSMMINREKHINSYWNKKIDKLKKIIENDLEILEIQRLIQKNTLNKIREEGMEEMELPKAVNTFEALNYLETMANKYQMIRYPGLSNLTIDGYCEQIKQGLERLEKLEKFSKLCFTKYVPLDSLSPSFWESKEEWLSTMSYDYYLFLCEDICEYVVKDNIRLTLDEFKLVYELLKEVLEND